VSECCLSPNAHFSSSSSSFSSSNLGTGFTRKCIRFRENFAQCRATQQSSTDYLQVKLYTGGRWSSCWQDAPWGRSWIPLLCWPELYSLAVGSGPWWSWGRTNYRRLHCSFFLDKGDLCLLSCYRWIVYIGGCLYQLIHFFSYIVYHDENKLHWMRCTRPTRLVWFSCF
jgi:hypothetical protein